MYTLKKCLFFILLTPLLFGCSETTNAPEVITSTSVNEQILTTINETRTTQYFSDESVPLEDITAIMDAGRNAMSGRNMQPWYFGAILNQEIIQGIASSMSMAGPPPGYTPPEGTPPAPTSSAYSKAGLADAPAIIAIASDANNAFAAGLACENMVMAATALGYGAKIVMGGAAQLNEPENRELLQMPEDMSTVVILIVGKPDATIDMTADGVTGASDRKPLNEISIIVQ